VTDSTSRLFAQNHLSRRRFLQFSAMGAGTVAVSPYLSRLEAFAAPPVAKDQGILVTIQLGGGNDGLNMVVPSGNPTYAALRPTLKITNGLSIGSGVALHPSLVKTKARYDQGNVAVVRGVGYQPPDLSHFTSTDIWMHGWGGSGTPTTGWAGRFLDGLPNTTHESLYGVSLHGNVNPHLNGAAAHPSSLPLSIGDAFGIDRSDPSLARMFDAVASFGNGASGLGPLGDTYNTTAMELMQLTQRIRPAYSFPAEDTGIGQQLVLAAHLINANLGIRVIDTSMGGFDTHSGQAAFHAELLSHLDAAIDAFFRTLAPRWRGQVAMMTFSEFGRRPDENGDGGTDHGAAAPLLVIGDHVRGGLHGAQPSLTDLDGDGDLKPAVDFRAVYATVLDTWLRADDREVLGRAYSPLSLFSAPPSAPPAGTPHTSSAGYWLAGPGGGIHGFGSATKFGSLPRVDKPIVAGASTHTHHGLWLCGTDGGIFSFGDAHFHGSMGGRNLDKPIVAMAATPSGKGYWLCASDGGIFCFGDAKFRGSMGGRHLDKPIVGMTSTPSGRGYWLCASDGGIFCFGDAKFRGSMGGRSLDKPIVAMAATPSGKGYWLCASDGGIFSYGDAHYHGSKVHTTAPVCGFARTTTGNGYWMTARDGMVARFGDAPSLGRVHAPTAVLVRA
jgi:uncharacterized protein (DUF1501 family)